MPLLLKKYYLMLTDLWGYGCKGVLCSRPCMELWTLRQKLSLLILTTASKVGIIITVLQKRKLQLEKLATCPSQITSEWQSKFEFGSDFKAQTTFHSLPSSCCLMNQGLCTSFMLFLCLVFPSEPAISMFPFFNSKCFPNHSFISIEDKQNIHAQKNQYANFYSSVIHNGQTCGNNLNVH